MCEQESGGLRRIPYPSAGKAPAGCPAAVSDGNYVYISQLTAGALPADIRQQTRQVLELLLEVLRRAGAGPQQLLQVSLTVADSRSIPAVTEIYRQCVPQPGPALVWRLGRLPGVLVAADAVARLEGKTAAETAQPS